MNELKIGNKVQTKHCSAFDKDYNPTEIGARKQHHGDIGFIINSNHGHGKCYEVQFALGKAWYEPDELSKVEMPKIEWIGKCKLKDTSDRLHRQETETVKVKISFESTTNHIKCEQRIPSIEDTPQYKEISLEMLDIYSVIQMIGENLNRSS